MVQLQFRHGSGDPNATAYASERLRARTPRPAKREASSNRALDAPEPAPTRLILLDDETLDNERLGGRVRRTDAIVFQDVNAQGLFLSPTEVDIVHPAPKPPVSREISMSVLRNLQTQTLQHYIHMLVNCALGNEKVCTAGGGGSLSVLVKNKECKGKKF